MQRAALARNDPATRLEESDDGAWRRAASFVTNLLQAMIVALLFGIVLLLIGIPFALIVRVIVDGLAWAAGAR